MKAAQGVRAFCSILSCLLGVGAPLFGEFPEPFFGDWSRRGDGGRKFPFGFADGGSFKIPFGEPGLPPLPGEPVLGERRGDGERFRFEGGVGVRGVRRLEPEVERDLGLPRPGDAGRLGDLPGRFGDAPGATGELADGDLRPECI